MRGASWCLNGDKGRRADLRGPGITVVVGVDVLFFRNRFWERLMVNVGVVLVFAGFYLRFLQRP